MRGVGRTRASVLGAGLLLAAPAAGAGAAEWTARGELGVEARLFDDDREPRSDDRPYAALGRVELRRRHGRFEERLRALGRFDPDDTQRRTLIAEEVWVQSQGPRLRLRLGIDLVNWTVMEAFHPADVVNARNLESDLENLEKIGEPMAAAQLRMSEQTSITVMVMPAYTAPRLPSTRSRLGGGPVGAFGLRGRRQLIDRSGAPTDADFGPQAAVQVRHVLGTADLAFALIDHMDRAQPLLRVDAADGRPVLLYQSVRSAMGSYQQALGGSVLKLEASYRWFVQPEAAAEERFGPLPDRDHGTLAAGLEHLLRSSGGWRPTLLLEAQAVFGGGDPLGAFDAFQRDVFVGCRWAADDVAGRQLVAGGIVDLEDPREHLLHLSYQQRIGERWTVQAALRLFEARPVPAAGGGLQPLREADHLRLVLTRHF